MPKPMPDRTVEMYRLSDGGDTGTWDTVMVELPADTHEISLEEVARIYAAKQYGPGSYMMYCSMDDDCPDVPIRSEVPVMLSFDMNEITEGSEIEQQAEAIRLVNLDLQRHPYGLGAQIEKID